MTSHDEYMALYKKHYPEWTDERMQKRASEEVEADRVNGLQQASPSFSAKIFLQRENFDNSTGTDWRIISIPVWYGNADKFLERISQNTYDEKAYVQLPREYGGDEDYAGSLLAVARKIQDAGKDNEHTTPVDEVKALLTSQDYAVLKMAPAYFTTLMTRALQQQGMAEKTQNNQALRVAAVEEMAKRHAVFSHQMEGLKQFSKTHEETSLTKDSSVADMKQVVGDLSTAFSVPEDITLKARHYEAAALGVRMRADQIGETVLVLDKMKDDVEKLNRLLGVNAHVTSTPPKSNGWAKAEGK